MRRVPEGKDRDNMSLPKYTTQKGTSSLSDKPSYSVVQQQEASSEESINTLTSPPPARQHHSLIHFGWWWEIGGIFFAILSTVAIIIILAKIDDQPISSWPYSIQPGTLVSIFSTIAKSALLVPVAVCISQLKWTYFEQPRELSHMQVFDDASRGPMGAVVLLWKTRGVAWLAGVGALVTVLVMTFEPFSQQAIHVGEKVVLMKNESGAIWSKKDFGDLMFIGNAVYIPEGKLWICGCLGKACSLLTMRSSIRVHRCNGRSTLNYNLMCNGY